MNSPISQDSSEATLDSLLEKINGIAKNGPEVEKSSSAPRFSSPGPQPIVMDPAITAKCEPSEEGFVPQAPKTVHEMGISETLLEELICKFLLSKGEATGRDISSQIRTPFAIVEGVLQRMKYDQLIAYIGQSTMNDYICKLSDKGRDRGRMYSDQCTYFGSAPVPLRDYIQSVKAQSIEHQHPTSHDLKSAFSDLLISPDMLGKLGPAVNSGRGMFLFGFPGNGKTSIAERVTSAFGKYVWLPRTVEVDGEIIRLFDPMNHVEAPMESSGGLLSDDSTIDRRWVRIERPTIVVGGELTMEHLEIQINRDTGISEAPIQLKSNCGTLVIDDFGRQRMSVDELLNRWIVPLEKRYDFLNTGSGKKVQVPFDQLVIFSTNLEPKDLVDDAFLRRIPYKIEVPNPPREDFVKLFGIMSKVMKFEYKPECVDYLIETHYLPNNRPFRNCHPRDLLLQIRNFCRYNQLPIEMSNDGFDFAASNYFSIM